MDKDMSPPEGSKCNGKEACGGKDIPESPLQMKLKPSVEPKNVNKSMPVDNDAKEAGKAKPDFAIKNGTYKVTYINEDIGPHKVSVKYGGQEVPNSSVVNSYAVGQADKYKIGTSSFMHPDEEPTRLTTESPKEAALFKTLVLPDYVPKFLSHEAFETEPDIQQLNKAIEKETTYLEILKKTDSITKLFISRGEDEKITYPPEEKYDIFREMEIDSMERLKHASTLNEGVIHRRNQDLTSLKKALREKEAKQRVENDTVKYYEV